MQHGDFIREKDHGRFQGFELLMVIIVVAFIIYMGIEFYSSHEKNSQETMVKFHAGVFSRMIVNIHALGSSAKDGVVVINNASFYLNENGWPANTDESESPSLYNQKSTECRQVWNSVFSNPPSSDIVENQYKDNVRYIISLNKNVICRYEMVRNNNEPHFIDYDISDGVVTVSR